MRLWSLDLKLLDQKGLTALWRETLLAAHVLQGKTKGYKNHPQLNRFKASRDPLIAINTYLMYIYIEATARGYNFQLSKIDQNKVDFSVAIPVTAGQVEYEFQHLMNKLENRSPHIFNRNKTETPDVNKMFYEIPGEIEKWEIL